MPQTSSLSNTCDSNLREEDDVVCANEVRLRELEGDNETDDVAQDCDNAISSQNEAPAEAAGQSESAVARADQSEGAEQTDETDEAIERESQDTVDDNARNNLENTDVSENAPTEAPKDNTVEITVAETDNTNAEQDESNADSERSAVGTETQNADPEAQDVDADAHFVDAESTSVEVGERAEVEELEEALTFDENHFSTPTGGATPERVASGRRMTSSSMDDTEVRVPQCQGTLASLKLFYVCVVMFARMDTTQDGAKEWRVLGSESFAAVTV